MSETNGGETGCLLAALAILMAMLILWMDNIQDRLGVVEDRVGIEREVSE